MHFLYKAMFRLK